MLQTFLDPSSLPSLESKEARKDTRMPTKQLNPGICVPDSTARASSVGPAGFSAALENVIWHVFRLSGEVNGFLGSQR